MKEFERRLEARPDIESPVVAERMRERLAASGMSVDEFISKLEQSGQEFDDLEGALRGTGYSASGLEDELEATRAQLEELELSDLFEGFEGRMQELETRFQLFDIDEPIDQLEKIRQTFLEFAELPAPLEQILGGADLSTAEGRHRFQEVLQQVFDMLASGELTPSQLGGLDPRQLQDLLTRMKSLIEEAAEQDGSMSAFQVNRQITEVTGNRLVGTLTTGLVLDRQRNRYLKGLAGAMGLPARRW